MEGPLKKKVSVLRGFQEKWFVLSDKGFLQYYESRADSNDTCNPKGRIYIALSDIEVKEDECSFKVTTNSGEKYHLRGKDKMETDRWINAIKTQQEEIKKIMFKGILDDKDKKPQKHSSLRVKFGSFHQSLKRAQSADNVTNDEVETRNKDDTTNQIKRLSVESVAHISSKHKCLMVAAIDFGSAYSGCAFSFSSSYNVNPLDIQTTFLDAKSSESLKSPTVVLLNPKGEFSAFGYEAEQKYADLVQNEEDEGWYYFRRFKMQLYTKKALEKNMMLKDVNGKEMKASSVFAICIENIKDTVFKRAEEAVSGLKEDDVHWILTVPAIWNESARQFMIEAAEKAGIEKNRLTLVLEPEAAAVCCKHLELQKSNTGQEALLGVYEPGSQFLVCDLGGGTVDITCNEIMETGQLREVYNASGGPWGGNMVNQRMWKLFLTIFGSEVIDKFIDENKDDYLDLILDMERKKRQAARGTKCVISLPLSLYAIAKESNPNIIDDDKTEGIKLVKNKLHLSSEVMLKVFSSCTDQICSHLDKILCREETRKVKALLLVGGFSACEMVKEAVRSRFDRYEVMCPLEPEMIVLKGAVIMGHMDQPVVGRLARYHYGIALSEELDFAKSSKRSMKDKNNLIECHSRKFHQFITKGDPIIVGEKVAEYKFIVKNAGIKEAYIEIYISESDSPPLSITEELCTKIGHIEVKIPTSKILTEIKITISYDETEFKVTGIVEHSGQMFAGVCSFLD